MAVKVSGEISLGSGTTSFSFENVNDSALDRQQYKEGLALEEGRFRAGSIAQKFFERLTVMQQDSRLVGNNHEPAPAEDAADQSAA